MKKNCRTLFDSFFLPVAMKQRRFFLSVWTIAICLLTLLPGNCFPTIQTFWDWLQWDKLVHLFLFGIFSILFLRILSLSKASLGNYLFAFVTGGIFGGGIELLQYYVIRGRNGNLFDFYADLAGCLICLAGYAIWENKSRNLKNGNNRVPKNQ